MTVEINSSARSSASTRFQELYALAVRYADALWMLVLGLGAIEYSLHYNIFLQAVPHDTTFHIYAAQQMLLGHPIYRDVAIIKAPLSDFATAFAILAARGIGISDVMGARLLSLLIAAATTSVTYLAGRVLFRSRAVGVLAGLVMAGWDFYGLRSVTGPEPKAFLILFVLLGLVCIARRKWFWAGVCAALTTLAWQPGLMLAAIAVLAALIEPFVSEREASVTPLQKGRRSARWRAGLGHAARVLGGALVPFGMLFIYLAANGAVTAAFNTTIGANVTHFNATRAHTPLPQMIQENFAEILADGGQYCFSPREDWLVITGALGVLGIFGEQLVSARRARRVPLDLERTPFLLYTLGFAAFSLVDFDFCPDLFPLLPVLALGTGWLGWSAARLVGNLAARATTTTNASVIQTLVVVVLALWLVWYYLLDVRAYQVRGTTFQDQLNVAETARAYLEPGDRVLSFGNAIVPVELHLTNATKILHLGSKSGLGVLASEPGGVQGMLEALDRNPPKLITLARENRPEWTKPFYEWLERRYAAADVFPRAGIRFFILRQ